MIQDKESNSGTKEENKSSTVKQSSDLKNKESHGEKQTTTSQPTAPEKTKPDIKKKKIVVKGPKSCKFVRFKTQNSFVQLSILFRRWKVLKGSREGWLSWKELGQKALP